MGDSLRLAQVSWLLREMLGDRAELRPKHPCTHAHSTVVRHSGPEMADKPCGGTRRHEVEPRFTVIGIRPVETTRRSLLAGRQPPQIGGGVPATYGGLSHAGPTELAVSIQSPHRAA